MHVHEEEPAAPEVSRAVAREPTSMLHRAPNVQFVARHLARIPRGRALDVAMGEGRHALLLAEAGFDVLGVDRDPDAVARVLEKARSRDLRLEARVADLEREGAELLQPEAFALIVNVNYLQRDLLARFPDALRPGGWLLFETFTLDHPRVSRAGRPRNPDFLLEPGELRERFKDLEIVEYEEGVFPALDGDRKAVARLAARKAIAGAAPDARGGKAGANRR